MVRYMGKVWKKKKKGEKRNKLAGERVSKMTVTSCTSAPGKILTTLPVCLFYHQSVKR